MSNDNTQGGAEPSGASAGSHREPAAWANADDDGIYEVGLSEPHAHYVCQRAANGKYSHRNPRIVPLYRAPTLTDEEREVLGRVADDARYRAMDHTEQVVRNLLERSTVAGGSGEDAKAEVARTLAISGSSAASVGTCQPQETGHVYQARRLVRHYDPCLICGRPVPGYAPDFCCSGTECGCSGQPINPCVCSDDCYSALFAGIGKPYDERRVIAGIAKWRP